MYATWLEFTSTVLALARFAIMRSWSGLIDRSAVATMYQLGLVFQAGDVTLWMNASVEIGTCDTAMNAALSFGMSAAKSAEMFPFYPPVGGPVYLYAADLDCGSRLH